MARFTAAFLGIMAATANAASPSSPMSFGVGRSQFYINNATETLLLEHNVSSAYDFATVNFCWITGDPLNQTTGQAGPSKIL